MNNNTTYSAKKGEVESKWYILDAAGRPLGRVATEAAKLLRGKHKPTFTPHVDTGDHVIIINCKDVVLTGNKLSQKIYRHHSGYIGGMKEVSAKTMLENGACIYIEDSELEPNKLRNTILELINNPIKISYLKQNSSYMAKPDAAKEIAGLIRSIGNR